MRGDVVSCCAVGAVVRSIAGRDKKREFIVIGERDASALIVDGALHRLSSPKKKNPRHLRLITRLSEQETKRLCDSPSDETVQDILKCAIRRTQTD